MSPYRNRFVNAAGLLGFSPQPSFPGGPSLSTPAGSVLVTAFEPFDGAAINPSAEVAAVLQGRRVGGVWVDTALLPVTASGAPRALADALERSGPVAALGLGFDQSRGELSLERVGLNLLDFRIPDNDGAQPVDQPVDPEGPTARLSTLPLRAVLAAWERRGVPGGLSNSAGTFVCNQVLYTLLGECARRGVPAGFIHVPALRTRQGDVPEPNSGGLPLEAMVDGVLAALEATLAG